MVWRASAASGQHCRTGSSAGENDCILNESSGRGRKYSAEHSPQAIRSMRARESDECADHRGFCAIRSSPSTHDSSDQRAGYDTARERAAIDAIRSARELVEDQFAEHPEPRWASRKERGNSTGGSRPRGGRQQSHRDQRLTVLASHTALLGKEPAGVACATDRGPSDRDSPSTSRGRIWVSS
jgi:hypothetical protein